MPRRDYYLNNKDEPIAAQKRTEREGSGVFDAVLLGGTVASFMLLRKKIALSKMFSERVKTIGESAGRLSKYIINNEVKTGASFLKKTPSVMRSWGEALSKKLPSVAEQRGLAESIYKRYYPKVSLKLPSIKESGLEKWRTFLHGPAYSAISSQAGLGLPTAPGLTSGEYGGIAAGKEFFRLGKGGKVEKVFKGIEQGLPKLGGRMESLRRGILDPGKGYTNIGDFFRNVAAPKRGITREAEREVLEKYLYNIGISNIPHKVLSKKALSAAKKEGIKIGKGSIATRSANRDILMEALESATVIKPGVKNILTPSRLLKDKASAISQSVDDVIETLAASEIEKSGVKRAFKLYRAQIKTGFGSAYSRYAAGEASGINLPRYYHELRRAVGKGYKHPTTGKFLPEETSRLIKEGTSLTGLWKNKIKGDVYLTQSGRRAYRSLLSIVEGTFYTIPEEMYGLGVTARRTGLTDFISKSVGAAPASWTGYAIRRHVGGMGRILGYGAGAYYGFKFINYLARQATGGWGVTDVAGKMYTSGREFQQNVLDQAGLREVASKMEDAFPGLIKSPAAHAFRMTAPLWMSAVGKKIGGTGGSKIGLALGIATALITWGDITQSPEELHEIFTGERDIPVRKGRYWPFGKTPLFGGKVKYWRPHWYPLMRSKYKFQGQLWDSETEYWAQGTALSPILAPILQGKMWDPYYWEKKHYQDRPYPMTGELFEPTMPGAWLGNLTIGNIIKPRKIMHPEYWGQPQPEAEDLNMVSGAGSALGMGSLQELEKHPQVFPGQDAGWETSMGLYTLTEQMGLRGFMMQQFVERLTGRADVAPEGPVVESAKGATGLERAYWDMNIGDPIGLTEFFRRILPHKRRQVERWNPIENTMPEWLPGEDYYNNFQVGDPYTKIETGEARLPGPGYESLHRLHSGTPGVYDAVDRFLVLSDVAPYSDEYKHYRTLAEGMSKGDEYWEEQVDRHAKQRSQINQVYDFLELEPPEDMEDPLRVASKAYRHAVAAFTNTAGLAESGLPINPVAKLFPYKTAVGTYKDYRIYGSDFTSWGHPVRDFVMPMKNKITGRVADLFGSEFIPEGEQERRDYEEYFDRLKYVKYKKLAALAEQQGNTQVASQYGNLAGKTMTGLDTSGNWSNMYGAMPKKERAFFEAFTHAPESDREEILDMVPKNMEKLYKAQWNTVDRKQGKTRSYDVGRTASRDVVDYYKDNYLPEESWTGWHPDVNLKDVKLKVVKNEGMNTHDFNLWQSQEKRLKRRPYTPTIDSIYDETNPGNIEALKRLLYEQMVENGLINPRIYVTKTASRNSRINLNINVRRDQSNQYNEMMAGSV